MTETTGIPPHDFIVIDDDAISIRVCTAIIHRSIPDAHVHSFLDSEDGLAFIQSGFFENDAPKAILFLDLNMPVSGWAVLDRISDLPETVKERLLVFVITSSVSPHDRRNAETNPMVSGFLVKPITNTVMHDILSTHILPGED